MKNLTKLCLLAYAAGLLLTFESGCRGGHIDHQFTYTIVDDIDGASVELPGLSGGEPRFSGAMEDADGNADIFVVNEIVMKTDDQEALDAFLEKYDGTIIRSGSKFPIDGILTEDPDSAFKMCLIRVNLQLSETGDLESNMEKAGLKGAFKFSSNDAAKLTAILARERHLPIRPNSLLDGAQSRSMEHPITVGPGSDSLLDFSRLPWMTEDDFLPTTATEGLSIGVIHAWDYLSYMGVGVPALNTSSVSWTPTRVVIIDGGFALDEETGIPLNENRDFFSYGDIPMQIDFVDGDLKAGGVNRTSCGGSDCPWHGQGSFGTCCARPQNGFGGAGSGGKYVIPILYRIDWTWYGAVEGMYGLGEMIRNTQFFGLGSDRADVISISMSGACYSLCNITELGLIDDFHETMQNAVTTAAAFGGVVVSSAGNGGKDLDNSLFEMIPCELENVICVGAIERNKLAKDYSNYGSKVDIWAPTDILSTTNPEKVAIDTNFTCDGSTCDELSVHRGTSAATPFTSGIVALMIALDRNKNIPGSVIPALGIGRPQAIVDILQMTANSSPDSKVTPGYVDAYRAVAALKANQAPSVTITSPINGASLSWKKRRSGFTSEVTDPEPGSHLPMFKGDLSVTVSSDQDGFISRTNSSQAWQTTYLNERPVLSLGQHQITVSATDPFGATGNASLTLNIVNAPPEAFILLPKTGNSFFSDQLIQFRGSSFDWDEQIPEDKMVWKSSIDGELGSGKELIKSLSQGLHLITLTVTDTFDLTGEKSIMVRIAAGTGQPSIVILTENAGLYGPGLPIKFQAQATDPEDGVLSGSGITWFSDIDGFLGKGSDVEFSLSGPPDSPCEGKVKHKITAMVTDSDGNTVSRVFSVRVGRIC